MGLCIKNSLFQAERDCLQPIEQFEVGELYRCLVQEEVSWLNRTLFMGLFKSQSCFVKSIFADLVSQ